MARRGIIPKPKLLSLVLLDAFVLEIISDVLEEKLKLAPVSAETEKCLEKWYLMPRKPIVPMLYELSLLVKSF